MNQKPLLRGLERYRRWFRLARTWQALQVGLFVFLTITAVFLLGDKTLYLGVPTEWVAVAGASLLALLLLYFILIPAKPELVGYLIDRNAGFKNLISSGLSVANQSDEVSAAVASRAERALQTQAPRRLIPFRLHWTGKFACLPGLALAVALFLPQFDLAGRKQRKERIAAERAEVEKSALKLAAQIKVVDAKADVRDAMENRQRTEDFRALATDLQGVSKKEALLKLGQFEDKYRKDIAKSSDLEQALKALKFTPDPKGLTPDTRDQLKKLMNNLQEGKLGDAAETMRTLAQQLQNQKLTQEERKALARELAKLAEKMQGAGINKDLAKLLSEIAASPEDLSNLLKQCEAAGKGLNDMADQCSQSEGLQAMRDGLAGAKKEMLGDSFKDFDARQVEQGMAAEAQLGGKGIGNGTGGEGRGRGGEPPENPTETAFQPKMSPSKINKGQVLQQLFVAGVPDKGDALAEYTEVVRSARQQAADSLSREQIPREYEEMVKQYFDSLEVKGKDEVAP